MDIQMPVMDGYEATKKIRALDDPKLAHIPVIAMTANVFEDDLKNERAAGMTTHVSKPIDVTELIATLAETIE